MKILLAEDDPVLSDGILQALRQAGHAADHARDGQDADFLLSASPYDLVILDLGLPTLDGLEVLTRFRKRGCTQPVLILTARDTLEDRIAGLDLGADDYLTKPFDLPELEARIRALIRRGHFGTRSELVNGPLRFDTTGRRVYIHQEPLDLSAREMGVLELLLINTGRVVSKEQLVTHLYGWDEEAGPNAIEVYIHRLRKKLEPVGFTFRTIRGLGYLVEHPT